MPRDTDWYEQLDGVLSEHGVPVAFASLISRAPVAIPESDDWPCVGHWGPIEIAAAEQLERLLRRLED